MKSLKNPGCAGGKPGCGRAPACAPAAMVLAFFILAGCSPIYYVPNTHNVPLLRGKGEGSLSVHGGSGRGEVQTAYAIGEGALVMLNGAFYEKRDDRDGDGGSGGFTELGAGHYRRLGGIFIFDACGLLGYGDFENHFPSTKAANPGTTGEINGKLLRYGAQSSAGFRTAYFDAALSLRIAGLYYYDVNGSLVFGGRNQADYLMEERRQALVEPAVTLRGGFDFFKLQLQLGGSRNLTARDFRQERGYLSFGALYLLNRD